VNSAQSNDKSSRKGNSEFQGNPTRQPAARLPAGSVVLKLTILGRTKILVLGEKYRLLWSVGGKWPTGWTQG
jgi:hypothetical protein